MYHSFHRYLLFCAPLLMMGCSDISGPEILNARIVTTGVSSTSVSLAWNKATDNESPVTTLVYNVYLSGPNPAYRSFDTLEEVEAGTLVQSLTDAGSATISSGIAAGNAYYVNIVVLDEKRNKTLYEPLGEYFHAGQISYYPFNGDGNNAVAPANPLVVAGTWALPVLTTDRFGSTASAYNFNPTTPQCLQSTAMVGIPSNLNRSVSFWVQSSNTPTGTWRAAFAWGNESTNGSSFGFFENGLSFYWNVWMSGTANVPTTSVVTSSWEHWVITYNSATDLVYTYKNGVVINDGSAPTPVANTVDTLLYVGCGLNNVSALSNPYQGNIDDVRVFDQVLSGTDVVNLHTVTQP